MQFLGRFLLPIAISPTAQSRRTSCLAHCAGLVVLAIRDTEFSIRLQVGSINVAWTTKMARKHAKAGTHCTLACSFNIK
jgi:hypothetical protein